MGQEREVIGNNIWQEDVRAQLLHIIPQCTYHADAQIRGSATALRRLGEALLKASAMKQSESMEVEMIAADGEGYGIVIMPMSDQQMDQGPLPYAQLGHMWDFDRCWNCDKARAALKAADDAESVGREGFGPPTCTV